MSTTQHRLSHQERIVVGIILIFAACFMFYMGFQCLTTIEYGLYNKNYSFYAEKASHYDEYLANAADCRSKADGEYGEIYLRRAQDWEDHAKEALRWAESAKEAQEYLTGKKIGHGCLMSVGLLGLGAGIWFLIPRKKKEAN